MLSCKSHVKFSYINLIFLIRKLICKEVHLTWPKSQNQKVAEPGLKPRSVKFWNLFICVCIYLFLLYCGLQDFSSLTRDWTWALGSEIINFSSLDARKFPKPLLLKLSFAKWELWQTRPQKLSINLLICTLLWNDGKSKSSASKFTLLLFSH